MDLCLRTIQRSGLIISSISGKNMAVMSPRSRFYLHCVLGIGLFYRAVITYCN